MRRLAGTAGMRPRRRRGGRRAAGGETGPRVIGRPRRDGRPTGPSSAARVVGQVDLQRRDRGMALQRSRGSRCPRIVLGSAGAADPVHRVAARAGLRDHLLRRVAAAEAADLEGLELAEGPVGMFTFSSQCAPSVRWCAPGTAPARAPCARRHRGGPALLDLREGDGRNAEQVALHRRAHRAGVDGVVAHVGAVVDAAHHQVGPVAQQARERDVHAVGRRAVDVAKAVGASLTYSGALQRQRVRLGAVVVLGRDHLDIAEVRIASYSATMPGAW
jgi:hypothetical protein